MSESSSDMSSVRDESIRQVVTMNKPTMDMCLFIQMEYCPFGSLREYLVRPKREVNVMKMLRVLHQIADALEYLHLQNYIHRDLKPGNIFFGESSDSVVRRSRHLQDQKEKIDDKEMDKI